MPSSEYMHYILLILATLIVAVSLTWLLKRFFNVFIRTRSEEINSDPTNFIFLKNSIGYIIGALSVIWICYNIPFFRSIGGALFAGAGILAAIVGFASQKAFSNIIGGLFILIFKPFRVGDLIEISNHRIGVVEEITLRHTIIRDFEHRRVVIPNSVISEETIINSNIKDNKIRKQINIGISYESDVDLAMDIIRSEIKAHPLHIDNRDEEAIANGIDTVIVRLIALGESSVNLRAYVWTNNSDDAFVLQCDVLRSIKAAFHDNGISIPYPHRTIIQK